MNVEKAFLWDIVRFNSYIEVDVVRFRDVDVIDIGKSIVGHKDVEGVLRHISEEAKKKKPEVL